MQSRPSVNTRTCTTSTCLLGRRLSSASPIRTTASRSQPHKPTSAAKHPATLIRSNCLQSHRHHDVPRVRSSRRMNQTAAVRISEPNLDLLSVDCAQRIQQVIHVEPNLH